MKIFDCCPLASVADWCPYSTPAYTVNNPREQHVFLHFIPSLYILNFQLSVTRERIISYFLFPCFICFSNDILIDELIQWKSISKLNVPIFSIKHV